MFIKRLTYIHILKTEKMESDFVKKLKQKNNLKLKIQYLQFKTNK